MTEHQDAFHDVFLQNTFWWVVMTSSIAVLLFFFITTTLASLSIKSRNQWGAANPLHPPTRISGPVPWVIIHHSGANSNCSQKTCSQEVKNIQEFHIQHRQWNDIGYNFLVAPTGDVFEGRGWGVVGSHAPKYNSKSVGICLIGDYLHNTPSAAQLTATQELIREGVEANKIKPLYKLIGHRQVKETECPGDALMNAIKQWPNYNTHTD